MKSVSLFKFNFESSHLSWLFLFNRLIKWMQYDFLFKLYDSFALMFYFTPNASSRHNNKNLTCVLITWHYFFHLLILDKELHAIFVNICFFMYALSILKWQNTIKNGIGLMDKALFNNQTLKGAHCLHF